MGQYYCDTKVLEKNWFHWLLSSSVPGLELYRKYGLLWTKILGDQSSVGKLPNPRSPNKMHCVALAVPIYIGSNKGILDDFATIDIDGQTKKVELRLACSIALPHEQELKVDSDSILHTTNNPFVQTETIIPSLLRDGYILEMPTDDAWHAMLRDIDRICRGIAVRFKQPTEEEQTELANEALLQVIRKLVGHKLVYIPGLAPVFNLLTTTIHRCMYSIMNRRKNQRIGLQKFCDDVQAGVVPGHTIH
jgi:hypothetical protein